MLPKWKNTFVLLYSIDTIVSSDGKEDLSKVNAFLGRMIEADFSAPTSVRRYLTKRCASVDTKVIFCSFNCTNTPDIAGRNSSLLTANIVLFIASNKIEEANLTVDTLSTIGILGKSSAFSPLSLYLPSPALISMAKVLVSTEKATG